MCKMCVKCVYMSVNCVLNEMNKTKFLRKLNY